MLNILTVKNILTVLSIIGVLISFSWGNSQRKEAEKQRQNLYSQQNEWQDEKGRLVSEVTELRHTTRELRAISNMDSSKMNEYQKELLKAHNTIKELNIRLRDAVSYHSGELEVKYDSLVVEVEKDEIGQITALKPIKTEFLTIEFDVKPDSILLNYIYRSNIVTVVNRQEDKLTRNGNIRFFIARWVRPRYRYWATTRVDDPNARINNQVYFNFE